MSCTFDFIKGEKQDKHKKPEYIANIKNGLFVYLDKYFYKKSMADHLYKNLLEEVVFDKNSKIKIFGKEHLIPREQTAYGDPGTTYSFSGTTVNARPWLPIILKIKNDVEIQTTRKFNFCLINYYQDGSKYIGYHKDDEQDLGSNPWIASITFGCERNFYFKSDNKDVEVVKTTLPHGSLCVMIHPTNLYWKHSVPKVSTKKCNKPRLNLTFRYIEMA